MDNQTVLEQLKEALDDPKFEMWNETSINHLLIASTGYNGPEAKQCADELVKKYISWKELNTNPSDGTFFGNPTVEYVITQQEKIKELKL